MAVDEAVANAVEKGISPPTLRFYGWKSPTLSIGYSQKIDKSVDTAYCRKNKIDIVLRTTGGRAVLHDKEITYSIISTKDNPLFPDNISGTYKVISKALIRGLSFLGVDASISELRTPNSLSPHLNPLPSGERDRVRVSCFAAASQYEILVNGKKLIGSAQRRLKKSFIQHGSIPIISSHDILASCLGLNKKDGKENFIELLKKRAIALNELNGRVFSYDEAADALIKGFKDVFKLVPEGGDQGMNFQSASLSEYELELSDKLYEKKKIL